jgi:cardiolipin synthase
MHRESSGARKSLRTVLLSRWFWIPAALALAFTAGTLFLSLFRPYLDYQIHKAGVPSANDPALLKSIQDATASRLFTSTRIETLTNGNVFYREELAAIAAAEESVSLEAYIFADGGIPQRFRDAAAERARKGVKVRLTLDSVGAMNSSDAFFSPLTDAGGRVAWYHPAKWYTWDRLNNRTHRELLIIDGKVGFTGGAGIADVWFQPVDGRPPWRDTLFKVTGDAVDGLQSVFAENWLETEGEVLSAPSLFQAAPAVNGYPCLVVFGTPSSGGSTRVRTAIQMTIAAARKTISITNPYFMPDEGVRQELADAVKRGVRVTVITPGNQSDQTLTSRASRRLYGELIESGVSIHEYQPTMIHVKTIVVDSVWSVIGTTNFDPRSFGLNDEVNVLVQSKELAGRLELDFQQDLEHSKPVTLEEWRARPLWERGAEFFGRLLERQQ